MNANLETIRAALAYMPAHDRDLWLRMGMAIKSELGEEGFALWDEWSQQDESHNERDAKAVWRSIKFNGKVTIGTLFHEAQRRGFKLNGHAKPESPTVEQLAERERQREQAKAEEAAKHESAKERAAAIWNAAPPASVDHPYLKRKGVKAHGLRLHKDCLVVPLRDVNGKLQTLEFIAPDGEKKYLSGGSKTGCYFAIGEPAGTICIAEGFATAASVCEATGLAVAAAMDAGNLKPVALALRSKLPDVKLILCVDDDCKTPGNPGMAKAHEAALAVNGLLALPDFGTDRPEGAKDFNDLSQTRGAEAVQRAIRDAKQPARSEAQASRQNEAAGDSESANWLDPLPMTARVATEPYPLDALPETVRAAVSEVQSFTKAPVALVASSALAALSLAIQAQYNVKRAENLSGPTSLYLLTIADSGERKTQCDGYFTRALREYEGEQAEALKPKIKEYVAALEVWKVKCEGVKAKLRDLAKAGKGTEPHEKALLELEQNKPQSPRVPRLMRGDETPEHLAYALAHEWPSAGVMSSEAGLIFGAHGMGRDSIMRNLGLLNILWDGGTHHIGRRTSESFTVQGARLTVALQLQEATLRSFFDRSNGLARGTGFLARFLIAWPESTMGTRTFCDAGEWKAIAAFDKRVSDLLLSPTPMDEQGTLSPQMLTLSAAAKRAWVTFHNAVEHELRSGGELYDVRDVAAKAAENVARLAALFHIFSGDMANAVSEASIESASRIIAWHLNESRRFFGELALPPELVNAARLDSWLLGYCSREKTHVVPIAKLQQFGPSGLRKRETIELALRELDELQRAKRVCNGHRKEVHINPALIERGDA